MEVKIKFLLITILFILIGILIFNFIEPNITGKVIQNPYSFTKAICNETNFCQDYEIICENNQTIEIIPISGAVVQHPFNWEDPRNKTIIDKLC